MMQHLRTYWSRFRRRSRNGHREVLAAAEAYDRWAASYGNRMNPLQEIEEEALRRMLPDLSGRDVLDVGCGTGRVAMIAQECGAASVVGVDISPAMLKRARSHGGSSSLFVQGDATSLPLEASTMDVVICSLVLGHVERLDDALSEMNRVLRPRGHVVISGFHPFATLRGFERTFEDAGNGRSYAIVQHVHLFEHYFRCFRKHAWKLSNVEEPLYEGFPIAFVLHAQKEVEP